MNKPWLDATVQFLTALANGNQLPERLQTDAGHVLRIMTADTAEIQHVNASLILMDGLKRSPEQSLFPFFLSKL